MIICLRHSQKFGLQLFNKNILGFYCIALNPPLEKKVEIVDCDFNAVPLILAVTAGRIFHTHAAQAPAVG